MLCACFQVIMESTDSLRPAAFSVPTNSPPPVYSEECDQGGLFQVNWDFIFHPDAYLLIDQRKRLTVRLLLPSACGVSSGSQLEQTALEPLHLTQQPAGDEHQRRGATQGPGGGGGAAVSWASTPSYHHFTQTHSGWGVSPLPSVQPSMWVCQICKITPNNLLFQMYRV